MRQAIDLYTVGGAWAGKCEGRQGALAPGYAADFVVLSQQSGDVFESPELFWDAKVDLVFVNGARKYDVASNARTPSLPAGNPTAQGKNGMGYRRPCKCCRGRFSFARPGGGKQQWQQRQQRQPWGEGACTLVPPS